MTPAAARLPIDIHTQQKKESWKGGGVDALSIVLLKKGI